MTLDITIYAFIAIGCFFNLMATIGLHRFPDFYTRLHAATKCSTFGSIFLVLAVIIHSLRAWVIEGLASPQSVLSIHAFIALIALLVTNPTGAHAIARAGYRSGVKPVQAVIDDLEGKEYD